MQYCYIDTPIGELLLAGAPGELSVIGFQGGSKRRAHEEFRTYHFAPCRTRFALQK